MRTQPLRLAASGLLTAILVSAGLPSAEAYLYRDVPDGRVFQWPIESLTRRGVLNGSPDGNFYPDRALNRVELLKLLYKATGEEVNPDARACYPDLEPGSWYEVYVCSAAAKGYVQGYVDGLFRPGKEVTRAEALKMIAELFDFDPPSRADPFLLLPYTDVDADAWFAASLQVALERGVLPIDGQDGPKFDAGEPLRRGEAAAYVHNALESLMEDPIEDVTVIDGSSSSSSAAGTGSSASSGGASSASSNSSIAPIEKDVTVPFTDAFTLVRKQNAVFRFSLSAAKTVFLEVLAKSGSKGSTTCRLYRLGADGISTEYYLGFQKTSACIIHAGLAAGDYQLEIRAEKGDVNVGLKAEEKKGDGNDGFSQAISLRKDGPQILAGLVDTDIANYYKFTVKAETVMTLELSSTAALLCLLYPGADVDLASFTGPLCNEQYSFPPGTYYVSVGHELAGMKKQTYTVRLK